MFPWFSSSLTLKLDYKKRFHYYISQQLSERIFLKVTCSLKACWPFLNSIWSQQCISYLFPIHLDVCHIVLKHSGDVDLWELVLTEDDEQTRLATRTIPDYHQLLPDSSHLEEKRAEKQEFLIITGEYKSLTSTRVVLTKAVVMKNVTNTPWKLCGAYHGACYVLKTHTPVSTELK